MASSVAIIASVGPQQTVTCCVGRRRARHARRELAAMASRSGCAPQVTAYWLMSARIAAHAASLTSSGAGKSGNPCDEIHGAVLTQAML